MIFRRLKHCGFLAAKTSMLYKYTDHVIPQFRFVDPSRTHLGSKPPPFFEEASRVVLEVMHLMEATRYQIGWQPDPGRFGTLLRDNKRASQNDSSTCKDYRPYLDELPFPSLASLARVM